MPCPTWLDLLVICGVKRGVSLGSCPAASQVPAVTAEGVPVNKANCRLAALSLSPSGAGEGESSSGRYPTASQHFFFLSFSSSCGKVPRFFWLLLLRNREAERVPAWQVRGGSGQAAPYLGMARLGLCSS